MIMIKVPIEDNLKSELPDLISNSMVIGDKRKFLTILVTLKVSFVFYIILKQKYILLNYKTVINLETKHYYISLIL